jgi:hypothetical protein
MNTPKKHKLAPWKQRPITRDITVALDLLREAGNIIRGIQFTHELDKSGNSIPHQIIREFQNRVDDAEIGLFNLLTVFWGE